MMREFFRCLPTILNSLAIIVLVFSIRRHTAMKH